MEIEAERLLLEAYPPGGPRALLSVGPKLPSLEVLDYRFGANNHILSLERSPLLRYRGRAPHFLHGQQALVDAADDWPNFFKGVDECSSQCISLF